MRTEREMFDLILGEAKKDERIRAVYMNGSKTNKNAPKDIFQDYDIVYVVKETRPFYQDAGWIDRFGERLYMQMPEHMDSLMGLDCDCGRCFGWLIQFADGNRLDIHVVSEEYALDTIRDDRLCRILLDKDGLLPELPEATDADHWVKRPSEMEFQCICNEFWWCLNNVAKGLWRKEVPYVMDMVNFHVRPQLVRMLSWKIGFGHEFRCSVGKSGKYLEHFLNPKEWKRFLETYTDGEITHIWEGVMKMAELMDDMARELSGKMGYTYDTLEAGAAKGYLEHVRSLPEDAKEVYP